MLTYWLLDVVKDVHEQYELAGNLFALNGHSKPQSNNPDCTIHIKGSSLLISKEPFFGLNQASANIKQLKPNNYIRVTRASRVILNVIRSLMFDCNSLLNSQLL